MRWLLELGCLGEDEKLTFALQKHKIDWEPISFLQFKESDYLPVDSAGNLDDDFIVESIFRGSIATASFLQRSGINFEPGVISNFENLKVSSYAKHYGERYLNKNGLISTLSEVYRRPEIFFYWLGMEMNQVFIRPDSNRKPFHAGVFDLTKHPDLDSLCRYCGNFPADGLVLVSKHQEIKREWRYIVSDRPISGSLYLEGEEQISRLENSQEVSDFVQATINESAWQPDKIYSLDVCELSSGELKLLEIGGFSCSAFYECDCDLIIEEVMKIYGES